MNYKQQDSYSPADVAEIVAQAKEFGSNGTLKAMNKTIEKEYVKKEEFDTVRNSYETLQTTYKTEKFDVEFKKLSDKYGITDDKQAKVIKTMGEISINDTPEDVENKVKTMKVEYPQLFTHTAVQVLPDPKDVGQKKSETPSAQEQVKKLNRF